jgi:hypothetical protein
MSAKYRMDLRHLWDLHSLVLGPAFGTLKIRFQRAAHLTEYAAFGLGRKSYSLPIRLDHHRRMAARRGRAVPPLLKKWA